jgi:tRNA(Arg) A34 adenosine deaminase TadA
MVAAGPLTVAELARAALYLSRAPCRACLETILSSGIPLMVLTCDGPLEESGGSTPERIHIPLEYDGEDGRWRLFAGGVCAVDADDNH